MSIGVALATDTRSRTVDRRVGVAADGSSAQLTFHKLILHNFKSFAGTHEINLAIDPGLYYVTGENKTNPDLGANGIGKSSIWDALFWALFDKTVRDNRPAAAILPWGFEKGQTWVTLVFQRGGEFYQLTRTRRPNSLTLNERQIEQQEIPQVLGMGEDIFRRTVILGQFGSLFLDLAPEAQARMFNEALDLNLWLRASDAASQAEKRAQLEVATSERKQADTKGRESETSDSLFRALENERNFIAGQARKLEQAEAKLAHTLAHAETIKGNPPANAPSLAHKGGKGLSALAIGETELTRLRVSQRDSEAALASLESERRVEEAAARKLRDVLDKYHAAQKTRTCPECGQKVTSPYLKETTRTVVLELATHEALVQTLSRQITKDTDSVENGARRLQQAEQSLRQHRESEQKYQIALNAWQLKCAQAESAIREAQAETRILKNQTNPYSAEVERLTKHLEKVRAQLAALTTEHTQFEQQAESAKYWVQAFKEIRLSLVDDALQELEIATNRHAEALGLTDWRIAFSTERETQSGGTSYKFSVWLYPPDQNEPVKFESYSGGESQRWQLAVAFGLEEVLLSRAGVTCNLLVLDEPTRGLSANGVEMLLEHLKERAHTNGQAIWFTDHHSLDRGAFDGTMWIEKDEHGSRITKIVV